MQAVSIPANFAAGRHQRGVVLVVALIFLLLITVLAISASGTSLLQEKLVGGLRNSQLAEWSAESALRGAEWRCGVPQQRSGYAHAMRHVRVDRLL